MNTFKKKSLFAAVLAGLGALACAFTANAVDINPESYGQKVVAFESEPRIDNLFLSLNDVYRFEVSNLYVVSKNDRLPTPVEETIVSKQYGQVATSFSSTVSAFDNSCATRFTKFDIIGADQKVKAKSYNLTWSQAHSPKWRDMNVTPEAG